MILCLKPHKHQMPQPKQAPTWGQFARRQSARLTFESRLSELSDSQLKFRGCSLDVVSRQSLFNEPQVQETVQSYSHRSRNVMTLTSGLDTKECPFHESQDSVTISCQLLNNNISVYIALDGQQE